MAGGQLIRAVGCPLEIEGFDQVPDISGGAFFEKKPVQHVFSER